MTKERSTKIVIYMTPWAKVLLLSLKVKAGGRGKIVYNFNEVYQYATP